jgi:poly(3-hydroxybutyrate) depolymerase
MQNGVAYDAAGSALQQFYGPLTRVEKPTGKLLAFDQSPYVESTPGAISLAKTGYLHVPQDCAAGQGNTCRLHVVFHGCEQSAERLGTTFVENAGVNEWADANRIVVLYPQLTSSSTMPTNPNGCWDFWGYNDALDDGRYATQKGAQISAVWKMAEALAGKGGHFQPEASAWNPEENERK